MRPAVTCARKTPGRLEGLTTAEDTSLQRTRQLNRGVHRATASRRSIQPEQSFESKEHLSTTHIPCKSRMQKVPSTHIASHCLSACPSMLVQGTQGKELLPSARRALFKARPAS